MVILKSVHQKWACTIQDELFLGDVADFGLEEGEISKTRLLGRGMLLKSEGKIVVPAVDIRNNSPMQ